MIYVLKKKGHMKAHEKKEKKGHMKVPTKI